MCVCVCVMCLVCVLKSARRRKQEIVRKRVRELVPLKVRQKWRQSAKTFRNYEKLGKNALYLLQLFVLNMSYT